MRETRNIELTMVQGALRRETKGKEGDKEEL
jgi:hypothetical protein